MQKPYSSFTIETGQVSAKRLIGFQALPIGAKGIAQGILFMDYV
jgi:hypothetical protein